MTRSLLASSSGKEPEDSGAGSWQRLCMNVAIILCKYHGKRHSGPSDRANYVVDIIVPLKKDDNINFNPLVVGYVSFRKLT